ncbi:MAG: DUF4199 domain-containing protein [Bernardetiaceae bacterium]|jgi:hypothetical protein|nr:DUF4199 domain-containing protein [Bernardetiaceae bacterium]
MNSPLVKISLLTGLLTGAAILAFNLLIHSFGNNPLGRGMLLFVPVYVMGLGVALRQFREQHNQGKLRGGEALSFSLIFNLAASVSYGLLFWAWLGWVSPAMLLTHQAAIRQKLTTEQAAILADPAYGQKFYDDSLRATDQMTADQAAWADFKKTSFVGLLLAIGTGLFFRKK